MNEKQFQEAIGHLDQTLTPQDEDTPHYLYALAMAHARAGNDQTAIQHARQAHRQATDLGQTELVESIKKDLKLIEEAVLP